MHHFSIHALAQRAHKPERRDSIRNARSLELILLTLHASLVLLAASGCTPNAVNVPEKVEPTTVSERSLALVPEPSADELGNSRPDQELMHVPYMGFLDGTTCESWPLTIDFFDNSSTGAQGLGWVLYSASPLRSIYQRLHYHGLPHATAIGSKRSLVIGSAKVSGLNRSPNIAYDPDSAVGYVISSQYLCTQEDEEGGLCDTGTAQLDGINVQTLYRKEARSSVPLVMLVAPTVRFPSYVRLDSHFMAIATRIIGGAPLQPGEYLPARAAKVDLDLEPWMDRSDWRKAVAPESYSPGFLALIADQTGGLRNVSSVPNRIDYLYITDLPPLGGRYWMRLKPADVLPIQSIAWVLKSKTDVTNPPEDHDPTRYINRTYDAEVQFTPFPRVRMDGNEGGTAILWAGARNTDLTITAPGAPAPSAAVKDEFLLQYVNNTLFPAVDSTNVDFAPYPRTHEQQPIMIPHGSPWLGAGYYPICEPNVGFSDFWVPHCQLYTTPQYLTAFAGTETAYTRAVGAETDKFFQATDVRDTLKRFIRMHLDIKNRQDTTVVTLPTPAPAKDGFVEVVNSERQALNAAHVFSRGLYFEQLYAHAENESLRSGAQSDSWGEVGWLSSNENLWERDASQFDSAKLTLKLGVSAQRVATAQNLGHYVTSALANAPRKLNALGLPYGQIAEPMRASRESAPLSLDETATNYTQLADLVEDFNAVAESQRTQFKLDDVNKRLDQVIGTMQTFMKGVSGVSSNLSKAAETNIASQEEAVKKLNTTVSEITKNQAELDRQIRTIWGCQNADMSLCLANMKSSLDQLGAQCEAEKSKSFFAALVGACIQMVPYVNAAAKVLEVSGLANAVGFDGDAFKKAFDDVSKKLDQIENYRQKAEAALDQVKKAVESSEQISSMVKQGVPSCSGTAEEGKVKDRLTQMALLNGLTQLYGTNLETLTAIIDGVNANAQNLLVTSQSFTALSSQSHTIDTDLGSELGQTDLNDVSERREFLRTSCRANVAMQRAVQADMFHVSGFLQTLNGASYIEPTLTIPADAHYRSDAAPERKLGYSVSLWEPARFGRRLQSDGTLADNFMALARKRLKSSNDEICLSSDDGLPPLRFLVRKRIEGDDLARFKATGFLPFPVTLEDMMKGGNVLPQEVNAIGARRKDGGWEHLNGPVVLQTEYSACNGPLSNPCCDTCRTSLAVSPYLVKQSAAYVPQPPDGDGDAVDTVTSATVLGYIARTSLDIVETPRRHWELPRAPITGTDQDLATDALKSYCGTDPAALSWNEEAGFPLLGVWGIAKDLDSAFKVEAGDAPASGLSDNVSAVEVLFVVTAQPTQGEGMARQSYLWLNSPVAFLGPVDVPSAAPPGWAAAFSTLGGATPSQPAAALSESFLGTN